jgi:hypothetical protein
VNRIVGALVFFAVALLVLGAWFWRVTKPVPRHLEALDAMGSRSWRRGGSGERAALLAPVHERRGEAREADLIVAPLVEGPAGVAEAVEDLAPGEVADAPEVDAVDEVPATAALAAPLSASGDDAAPDPSYGEGHG